MATTFLRPPARPIVTSDSTDEVIREVLRTGPAGVVRGLHAARTPSGKGPIPPPNRSQRANALPANTRQSVWAQRARSLESGLMRRARSGPNISHLHKFLHYSLLG